MRPIFTILRLFSVLIIRGTGVNANITNIITNNLFHFSSIIYTRFGLITTIRTLFTVVSFLRNRVALTTHVLNRTILNTHPEIRTLILEYLAPNWETFLSYRKRIFFIIFSSMFTSFLAMIKPMWILRLILGLIASSLGCAEFYGMKL